MFVRSMKFEERDVCLKMLLNEGIDESRNLKFGLNTYVLEDGSNIIGFFHFIFEKVGYPVLMNFCIKKSHRDTRKARYLMSKYLDLIETIGYKKTVIVASKYLDKIIRRYFKVDPYGENEKSYYYLVEV